MSSKSLTRNIFIALILGVIVGIYAPETAPYVSWLGRVFKLSLAMIVMPIILFSILDGIGTLGDVGRMERFGAKTLVYFVATTLIAVFLGLFLVTTFQPGVRKPTAPIASAIDAVVFTSPDVRVEELTRAIDEAQPLAEGPKSRLMASLEDLAVQGHDDAELKTAAKAFMGSLPLRERVQNKDQLKPKEPLSPSAFMLAQIDKMLVNPFAALADMNVLAIIVFAILFGFGLTKTAGGKQVFALVRVCSDAMTWIVHTVMAFAPFGVFGLLVDVLSVTGSDMLQDLGWYALVVIIGLCTHLFVILPALLYLFTGMTPYRLFYGMREAMAIAFSTSSSNATLPISLANVEENLNISPRVSRFVLPLGATMNMNGTALYEAVAAVFIAQLYGVGLSLSSQVIIALTAALAAVGAAGIPAAGTVTITLVLSAVGLPLEGIGLLLAVDRPLDMCRTAVNVMGDAVGCVILERWAKRDLATSE